MSISVVFAAALVGLPVMPLPDSNRVDIHLDSKEARAVLNILEKRNRGVAIDSTDWRAVIESEGYRRLKHREASLHRDFTDQDFRQFVLSDSLARRAGALRETLEGWERSDLEPLAARALRYLPADAKIRTTVYPVIKPQTNSFVFEASTNAAIFLYLDPKQTVPQFDNTVTHELHHIGYTSVGRRFEAAITVLPVRAKTAAEWVGAFGEGFAMLAAAGSPDTHPHEVSVPEDRARWDHDLANFNHDLRAVEGFLRDIIDGRLTGDEKIREKGSEFFGTQGPWYTVGWKMATVIERRFGRPWLIECMLDPLQLLATYNEAATELNRRGGSLALWSVDLFPK